MLLHAAFVSSPDLAVASVNLKYLAESLLDSSLYYTKNKERSPGFLNSMFNVSILQGNTTTLLDQFSHELLLLGSSGVSQIDSLQKGLIAAAIEYYHEHAQPGTVPNFFQSVTGGVQFNAGALADTGTNKGLERLRASIVPVLSTALNENFIKATAASAEVWTIQSGTVGLETSGLEANEIQIGAMNNGNTLRGGGGDDLLVGGASNDLLEGGTGRDTLVGNDYWQ